MDTLDKILAKVEAIREDQIRELERVGQIIALLRPAETPPPLAPPSALPIAATDSWTSKVVPLSMSCAMWLVRSFWKHLPTIGAVIYMKATGQDAKILEYLNATLFGI